MSHPHSPVFPDPARERTCRGRLHGLPVVLCVALGLFAAACRDSSVKAYRIPKETQAVNPGGVAGTQLQSAPAAGAGMSSATLVSGGGADLAWTAPAQWKIKPASAMRKGSYVVGNGGAQAEVSITAFPGDVGGEVANVNRWRGQLQLTPVDEGEIGRSITRLQAGTLTVSYVNLTNGTQRMLAAFVPFDGATWFVKLTGPDAVVSSETAAFVEFLQTLHPAAADAPAAAAAPTGNAAPAMGGVTIKNSDGPDLKWTAPADWQPGAPNAMRKASYRIAGADGATAEVSITAFPGDVGGELANLNRWRNQLGLPGIAASELAAALTHRERGSLKITLVDIASPPGPNAQRLLGAMVPFDGATWFFKLTGPDALVARERAAFSSFLDTLQAP